MTERSMKDNYDYSESEFDRLFDEGMDITPYVVAGSAHHPGWTQQRKISMNMPVWLINELDYQAKRLAVPRQAIINLWLAERVEQELAKSRHDGETLSEVQDLADRLLHSGDGIPGKGLASET